MANSKTSSKSNKYKVTLEMGADLFESEGVTALDALTSLPIDYTSVKSKGTITLYHNNKKSARFLYMRPLRLVMANKLRKAGMANNLEFLLA
jgi:hypothetical protein